MRTFNRFHRRLGTDRDWPEVKGAVFIALGAGVLLAIVKSVAAVFTGSASMLAEAVHSWIGALTDGFLVAAYMAARRPADETHVLGYGRESYLWSLFGSVAMFTIGAEVGIWRGIHQLSVPDAATDYRFGYIVLASAFVLQSWSFVQAIAFLRQRAAELEHGMLAHVFRTSDSQLRTVITGDFIALVGLVVAAAGMALHQLTGNVVYDALGSFIVGLLMGAGGSFLISMNGRFLAGVPLPEARRALVIRALNDVPEILRVTHLFAEFIGPDRLILAAHVELAGDHSQDELARTLRRLEARIMEHPRVGRVSLTLAAPDEPDAH